MRAMIQALEKLMAAQLEDHRELLKCIERKCEAVRTARMDSLTDLIDKERSLLNRISDIERHRVTLVQQITQKIDSSHSGTMTISGIAEAQPDEQVRIRLLAIAAQLRDCIAEVRKRSSVVRAAAEALARHMSGVIQSVHSALSRAGVYGQTGRVAVDGPLLQRGLSVDLKS